MANFRPGELDQRIKFYRAVRTDDGMGGATETLELIYTRWALVRPMSGSESKNFDKLNAEAMYLFAVRYPLDILDSDRILWDGDYYNIRARKKPTGRELYMQIEAERGVAQ